MEGRLISVSGEEIVYMKAGSYFFLLLLGAACILLTVGLIAMAYTNQQLQARLQAQQQALNQGVLGQQGQQISAGVLQDLSDASVDNSDIRQLLEKNGYRVASSRPAAAARSSTEKKQETTPNTEVQKP